MEEAEETTGELLSEYFEWRKTHQKHRRLENVYLLVALAIIGWYVSTTDGDLVRVELTFDGLFFGFAMIAFAFVVLKVNTLALGEMTDSKVVNALDNRVAPLLFFWGFNGVVLSALMRPFVAGQHPLEVVIVVVDFLVSFGVSVLISDVSAKFSANLRQREQTLEQRFESTPRGEALITAVFQNPELVDSEFTPIERGPRRTDDGQRLHVDVVGRDEDDRTTFVRVEDRVGERRAWEHLYQMDETPDKRWVLLSPSFSEEAKSILGAEDAEYVETSV